MTKKVKNTPRPPRTRTRISSKHQVTIPKGPFHAAGLREGDTLQVSARGAGEVVLTRVDELVERYSGALDTGGGLRREIEEVRREWR